MDISRISVLVSSTGSVAAGTKSGSWRQLSTGASAGSTVDTRSHALEASVRTTLVCQQLFSYTMAMHNTNTHMFLYIYTHSHMPSHYRQRETAMPVRIYHPISIHNHNKTTL